MKRSPLRRKRPMRKGRVVWNSDDDVRERVRRRSRGVCELCRWGPATDMHHRKRRSRGGQDTEDNLVHLCHASHMRIHENPEWSYRWGWLLKGHEDPAAVPWGVERTY